MYMYHARSSSPTLSWTDALPPTAPNARSRICEIQPSGSSACWQGKKGGVWMRGSLGDVSMSLPRSHWLV
jgi:hypothetical protein